MALEPTPDPLERAIRVARDQQPEGWIELTESIMSRVRSVVRPAEPLLAFDDTGAGTRDAEGSRTFVSSRLVLAALRRTLQAGPTHAPAGIDLTVDDGRLAGVQLSLVGTYGADLRALAEVVRAEVLGEIDRLIGTDPQRPVAVEIAFVDVVQGDPNRV